MLEILYGSGTRVSELCSLDVAHVRSGRHGDVPDALAALAKAEDEWLQLTETYEEAVAENG